MEVQAGGTIGSNWDSSGSHGEQRADLRKIKKNRQGVVMAEVRQGAAAGVVVPLGSQETRNKWAYGGR